MIHKYELILMLNVINPITFRFQQGLFHGKKEHE